MGCHRQYDDHHPEHDHAEHDPGGAENGTEQFELPEHGHELGLELERGVLRPVEQPVKRAAVGDCSPPLRVFGRGSALTAALVAAVALLAGCGGAGSNALAPLGNGIRGPSGLAATVYASGLPHLAALTYDSQGRLWATASGSTTHRGDGVYLIARPGARPVKVIGDVTAPLGLVWVGRRLIVASLGRVTAYSGFDGTSFHRRRVIVDGPVAGGENNNIVLAPDGRLVMGVSASCDHCVPRVKWSGAIVSFRVDGSDLRLVAGRIRAPFGLAYVPGTNTLYASMNQRDDLGAQTPGDWLARIRPGENWGFPACYGQGGRACGHKPSPVGLLDAHAAAGGVALLTSELGGGYRASALVAEWQFGIVKRVALGAASGKATTFLTGFGHPLPVITTPDGAVLVGDWGRGVVYRIARTST